MPTSLITFTLFLPLLLGAPTPPPAPAGPVIHVPHFETAVSFRETAIVWFGQVTPAQNYTDLRVGYSNSELYVNTTTFDRLLWYDPQANPNNLLNGDASILYLETAGPNPRRLRFTAQLSWWEPRANYQAAAVWNGSAWQPATIPFTTQSGWRGNAPNDYSDDAGWTMTFHIPFSSLGVPPPEQGTRWRIAVTIIDLDAGGGSTTRLTWPPNAAITDPATWAGLSFGLPQFVPPPIRNPQQVLIRHNLNGVVVRDASLGGDTTCGAGLDRWSQWGLANYAGLNRFNIQNQADVSDFPCFNKAYIVFPLTSIPPNKEIVSATLKLHLFGNAGNPGESTASLIQISTISGTWNENTITWNNAPLPEENVSYTWVQPVDDFPGWPGIPYTWDVSRAVRLAYQRQTPFSIVIYSPDDQYNSGKYFVSSDTEEWNSAARPQLLVEYGDPAMLHGESAPTPSSRLPPE